jgi:hypothetical protein
VQDHIRADTILEHLRARAGKDVDLSVYFESSVWGDFPAFYAKQLQSFLEG